ncbi:hypothetical protein [Novosphingobium sp. LASN5T]|uniref:hypothetical protein n=1 Tax=Novosphingobium sp. LASN5T TaxID=2491021 RepID=UPI000F5E1417|nr:hypothetical protein [Novosphingobium sp. LASN5T]RQW40602.1 hypothetical protein EH199_20630 [Novosphingobium sp. LASN5T]
MVSFSNFHRLDHAARQVAIELLANADQGAPPSFMSFTYRWMAFNGWMSAVTLQNQDWKIINVIAGNEKLGETHDALLASEPYRERVTEFAALWPVFNVRDARKKLGYDVFAHHDRHALLATDIRRQPEEWEPGASPSWDQLIRAIYQVRCNMFHGEKSPQNARDHDLIRSSDRVLGFFIVQSGCFAWHDQ